MDIAIYAGHIVIWCIVWAIYYLWAHTTGRTGFVVWVVFLAISGAASVAYYAAVSAGFSAYYWVEWLIGRVL